MKKKVYNVLTVGMLAIYFAFASGVAFTVHHCCEHCFTIEETLSCSCDEHHDEQQCDISTTQHDAHHHAHDAHFFFKIVDFYDVSKTVSSAPWQFVQTAEKAFNPLAEDNTILIAKFKEHFDIPSIALLQGNLLFDLFHKRLFYS